MKRRSFITTIGTIGTLGTLGAATGLSLLLPSKAWGDNHSFRWEEPFDGAILHERYGSPVLGVFILPNETKSLKVKATGFAPEGCEVEIIVNKNAPITVFSSDGKFSAEVHLTERFNEIKATTTVKGNKETIVTRPVWLQNSFKRYCFQIDDCSFFLRDITEKDYADIFDCFYLYGLRKLHRKYGTKFALNCFYSTPQKDFDLSMMSDKYKSQWEENESWLRLTFHAKNEFPDRPYENASPEKLATDFDELQTEVVRFAGKAYAAPAIVHWGTVRPEAHSVLKERGVRWLSGYFTKSGGNWIVHFQLPEQVCEYLAGHDGWYDYKTGIVFSKLDIVCNSVPLDKTVSTLQTAIENPHTAEVLDLLTHEQYFWPYYHNYLPDHFQRLDTAIRFAVDHGYQSVWHNDGFYGTLD